jgi:hypothetical protein
MIKLGLDHYVPSLRWRQGEYQALLALTDAAKSRSVPLITIPHIEYDFEAGKPKHTVHEHVEPFPKRYKSKWGTRPAWIDFDASLHKDAMQGGQDVITYVFESLRTFGASAVPVLTVGADKAVVALVAKVIQVDKRGIALRARFEDIMRPSYTQSARELMKALAVSPAEVDFIVDLGAPSYEPYAAFATGLKAALLRLGDLPAFRNFVLLGTAMPDTLSTVSKDGADLPRHDWLFYQAFAKGLPAGLRRPNYGDYTVVHPSFSAMDMRMLKPAGKIVYATSRNWAVYKGGAFRDDPTQMHDHCGELVDSDDYMGPTFSYGDEYIDLCAKRKEGPSNQTQWKKVAINHHITQTLADLSKLVASP